MAKRKHQQQQEVQETRLMSIVFWCSKLKKNHTATPDLLDWSASQEPCEMCGEHGSITVSVKCDCEIGRHDVEVKSW